MSRKIGYFTVVSERCYVKILRIYSNENLKMYYASNDYSGTSLPRMSRQCESGEPSHYRLTNTLSALANGEDDESWFEMSGLLKQFRMTSDNEVMFFTLMEQSPLSDLLSSVNIIIPTT